jgi:excisionase family DNA binding protein
VGSDSSQSQVFAPFTEDFADRLRTLLSVMDVAERLAVSTKTVYALCASGTLRHFRVLNAIRVAPADLEAYLLAART